LPDPQGFVSLVSYVAAGSSRLSSGSRTLLTPPRITRSGGSWPPPRWRNPRGKPAVTHPAEPLAGEGGRAGEMAQQPFEATLVRFP